jgi:hypothetical protein
MLSDIVHSWAIEPGPQGCRINVLVAIPDTEAARTDDVMATVKTALSALVACAEFG